MSTLFLPAKFARGTCLFPALRRVLAGLAALSLALTVCAAAPARRASSLPLPPALQALARSGKVKILSRFPTALAGLAGYVVRYEGDTEVVYGEGGYLFVGELISPKNADLNARYRTRYEPTPDYGAVIRRLDRGGHLITEGPANAPRIYAIIDPNCSFCYRFYHMAEPLISAGRLQVRWVLVGFLESTSRARAAAILTAVHPQLALRLDEDRFDVAREHGGIAPAKTISPLIAALLKAHLDAMSDIGGTGTPTLMFRKPNRRWSIEVGLPPESWLTAYAHGGHRR